MKVKRAAEEASEHSEVEESTKKLYDTEKKRLDFINLTATDLKNNKRVILPGPDDDNEEIRRNNLKSDFKNIVIKYKKENCDKHGNILNNNLSDKQLKEVKNLKNRIDKEGLTCGETDKTGKFTLDTLDNVTEKMKKHIKDDKVVNAKEVKAIENKLNRHMDLWTKMLKPGENFNQTRRVKSNLKTKDSQIPILRGTRKDHKEALDNVIGHDLRPIMGAIVV